MKYRFIQIRLERTKFWQYPALGRTGAMKVYIGNHLGSNLAMTQESENVANNLKVQQKNG